MTCQYKYYPLIQDAAYANALRNKVEAFRREHPGCHKAIHVVMVTLGGVARNAYYHEIVTDDIRGEDLFS